MRHNVGEHDRTARTIAGLGLLSAALLLPMGRSWRIAVLALAGIVLSTAAARYCPLNDAIGLDTRHGPLRR